MECKIIRYNKGNHTVIYYNIIQTNMESNKRKKKQEKNYFERLFRNDFLACTKSGQSRFRLQQ